MKLEFCDKLKPTLVLKLEFCDKLKLIVLVNLVRLALLAQWLERAAVNRKVTGSIPVGSVFDFSEPNLSFYSLSVVITFFQFFEVVPTIV